MTAVLDYILKTNLFNFLIFAGIIVFIAVKLNFKGAIENAKDVVKEGIENSVTAKEKSEENLSEIEDKVAHLAEEIDEIISKSIDNAKHVGEQIIIDAQKTAENIKDNSEKLVENRGMLLRNDILKKASMASVEIAKNHIKNELNNNYELHNKLIDESIEALAQLKDEVANG